MEQQKFYLYLQDIFINIYLMKINQEYQEYFI